MPANSAQALGPTFYFDLASPLAYLAAEQAPRGLGATARWQPVLASGLAAAPAVAAPQERGRVEALARELTLPVIRWPASFPFDSESVMRAATYAAQIGRVIAFTLAAFRQAFAAGHDLSQPDWILIAAAACEMHPRAVLSAMERPAIAQALLAGTADAAAAGVREVPSIATGGRLLSGERAVEALWHEPAGVAG